MSDNMLIWDKVCRTPVGVTAKKSRGSFDFTNVEPAWAFKRATEMFGPYGMGWGLRNVRHEQGVFELNQERKSFIVQYADFWYVFPGTDKEISFPVCAEIAINSLKATVICDTYKSLETTVIKRALRMLGFAADVYEGKHDDVNYLEDAVHWSDENAAEDAANKIEACSDESTLRSMETRIRSLQSSGVIGKEVAQRLLLMVDLKREDEGWESPSAISSEEINNEQLLRVYLRNLKLSGSEVKKIAQAMSGGKYNLLDLLLRDEEAVDEAIRFFERRRAINADRSEYFNRSIEMKEQDNAESN